MGIPMLFMAFTSAHITSFCGTLQAPAIVQSTTTMSSGQNSISTTNDDHSDRSLSPLQDDTISSTEYARRCREFLEFLKDLNNLGYAPLT